MSDERIMKYSTKDNLMSGIELFYYGLGLVSGAFSKEVVAALDAGSNGPETDQEE